MAPRIPNREEKRGNYSMFMGVFAVSVVGFGALGVDISYIAMANKQAQAVADAASHAALIEYRNHPSPDAAVRVAAGNVAAQHYVDNNTVGLSGQKGTLAEVIFGQFDPSTDTTINGGAQPYNAAYARVERTNTNALDLFLAPIIGHADADVSQEGITAANPRNIMVVVDRSCSMHDSIVDSDCTSDPADSWHYWTTGGGTEYRQRRAICNITEAGWYGAEQALAAFSSYMVANQVDEDMLGYTTFSSSSSGGHDYPLQFVADVESTIVADWSAYGDCEYEYRERKSGGSWNYHSVRYSGYTCSGSTSQAAGMSLAIDDLINNGHPLAFKALIVVSDGNPTSPSSSTGASEWAAESDRAWANDIHIWTVGFGGVNTALLEANKRGIGKAYFTPNASELDDVMLEIARSIPIVISD